MNIIRASISMTCVAQDDQGSFRDALRSVSLRTKAWVITDGLKACGQLDSPVSLVGEALKRAPGVTCIGIAAWDAFEGAESVGQQPPGEVHLYRRSDGFIQGTNHVDGSSFEATRSYSDQAVIKRLPDVNHTHLVFVDKEANEALPFRSRFQDTLREKVRGPIVVMAASGMRSHVNVSLLKLHHPPHLCRIDKSAVTRLQDSFPSLPSICH